MRDHPLGSSLMRIAAFVGGVLIANVITIGGIALLVLFTPERVQELIWLPVVALTVFVYVPVLAGSLTTYWDVRASLDSRRYFQRWFIVSFGLQVLGAVAVVVFAVLAAAPAWLPVLFIAVGVVLDVAALRVGRALRLREESRRRDAPAWQPIARTSIVRRVLVVAAVFAAVLVLASIAALALFPASDSRHGGVGLGLALAAAFAFMAAALACILVTIPLNRMIREQVSRDIGELRRIAKVVLRGRPIPLSAEERTAAAKYAVIVSVSLPFTLAYLALLYAGLGTQQVAQMLLEPDRIFPKILLVSLVAVLVVLLPLYVVRIRRARAYARSHAEELPRPVREEASRGELRP